MPYNVFQTYRKMMEPLKASEALEMISAVSHPHRNAKSQKEVISKLEKPLNPFKKKKSLEEMELEMRGFLG